MNLWRTHLDPSNCQPNHSLYASKKPKGHSSHQTSMLKLYKKKKNFGEKIRSRIYLQTLSYSLSAIGQSSPSGELSTLLFWIGPSEPFKNHWGNQILQPVVRNQTCKRWEGPGGSAFSWSVPLQQSHTGSPSTCCRAEAHCLLHVWEITSLREPKEAQIPYPAQKDRNGQDGTMYQERAQVPSLNEKFAINFPCLQGTHTLLGNQTQKQAMATK